MKSTDRLKIFQRHRSKPRGQLSETSDMYGPLDDSRNEIRILTVLPSKIPVKIRGFSNTPVDSICCILEKVSLDDLSKNYATYLADLRGVPMTRRALKLGWEQHPSHSSERSIFGFSRQNATKRHLRYKWGDYLALSYTWGDPSAVQTIIINGAEVQVRKNLERALRDLRDRQKLEGGLRLWVDALCINQLDVNERNRQLKRIRTIYAEAQSVSVWLGQSGDGSTEGGQAIDFLVGLDQEIREEEQKQLHLQAQNEGVLSCLTNVFEYMEYAIDEYTWPALAAFFTRTYWRRIWIIQELTMGLEWLTFSCNGHEVSLSTLMRTAEFFSNRSETFVYKFLGEDGEGRNWQKVQAMSSAINLITRLKDLHEDIERFEMAETIQGLGETHQTRPSLSSLFEKLSLIRNADATEDHDKVYGILGLLHPTLRRRIDPDCLLPVEDIYVNFMQNLLKDTLYLGFVCYGSQVSSLLPSWVIDWRKPSDRSFLFMEQSEKEHSGLQLSVEAANTSISEKTDTSMGLNNLRCDIDIHFSENSRLLHCKGVQLTRIDGCLCSISPDNLKTDLCPESVDTPTHLPLPPIENMIQFLVESTEKLTQPTCTNSVYPDLKTLKSSLECSILWSKSSTSYDNIGIFDIPLYNDLRPGKKILDQLRTNNWNLVKHTIYYKQFTAFRRINAIFNFCGTKFQDLFSTQFPEDPDPEKLISALHRFSVVMMGRKIVTTENGLLGCTGRDTQPGDHVFRLQGCNMPVIIRPRGPHFEVVGECFMDRFTLDCATRIIQRDRQQMEEITLC